jgi:hypothetical protein
MPVSNMDDAWVRTGMCAQCRRKYEGEVRAAMTAPMAPMHISIDEAVSLPGLRSFVVEQEIIPRQRRIEGMLSW